MKKVLLLCGGNSTEHDVSLISAKSILENIDTGMFEVTPVIIDFDNIWYEYLDEYQYLDNWHIKNVRIIDNIVEYLHLFDIVFPIIHGYGGEDGKLQGMLDLFDIKYVGCKTLSSAACMDKDFSKMVFSYLGIPQVPFITLTNSDFKLNDIVKNIGFPMIVKPANGGSSIGISKATSKRGLKKAINDAFKYDEKVVVEKFINARELECAVLEEEDYYISEVGEIKSANEFYDYEAKYVNAESYTIIPAKLEESVSDKIKEYAEIAFKGINCRGLARIDFFYDEENNEIYLNEINTLPGFTSISMYPKLFINEGISYKDLITKLINNC